MDNTFRLLGRQGLLGMAMAGLDMALWDALGKSANMPVAALLGGYQRAIVCYDSPGGFNAKTSTKILEQSLRLGFKAVKFKIDGIEALFERTRRKPNLANRVDQDTEQAVIKSATDFPAYGQARTDLPPEKRSLVIDLPPLSMSKSTHTFAANALESLCRVE